MGVAIGDYDNDGRDDVYITALDGDHLFHNEGDGHFRDVTKESGIRNAAFSASAAWLDYDRDGKLDLFVANYVQWTPQGDLWCSLDGSTKSYCTPESYKGTSAKLYHNLGGGKFEDVTEKAGVARSHQQVAGRDGVRLQQRRLARPLRRQRHAAQQALPQPTERPLQGRRR